jgi:ectoine hydroxylase-related dioxygenase (phytanoyl-CoA dioxygenase family)
MTMRGSESAELVERYRRDGFVHVRGLIPVAEIERLAAAVDHAVATRKARDTRPLEEKTPYEQSFIQCQYVWEDFAAIRPLTFHAELGRTLALLLGAERVRLWHDQALYKEAGGRETEAHQDHAYWPIAEEDTITAWIPLCTVDERSGCMGYVPGSHRAALEFVDIFRTPGAGAALLSKQSTAPVFVPAVPGDVIFHHGRTIHLAMPNRSSETRRVYTAIYFKDGCTRSGERPHPSVDRAGIAVGARIDSPVTPIAWPLTEGKYPQPVPWPASGDERTAHRSRMGTIPNHTG